MWLRSWEQTFWWVLVKQKLNLTPFLKGGVSQLAAFPGADEINLLILGDGR